jgi:hypothetical protein
MVELTAMMRELAQKQLAAISQGSNVQHVANLPLNKREPILIEGTKVE